MSANPLAVEFHGVSKRYGSATAVDDVSFTIERGTLVTLLGPSGCGKTTTLRLIAGLETPSDGEIHIAGRDVTLLSAAERNVSLVFQSYALFPHMTVLENAAYGLVVGGMAKAAAREKAREKLRLLGLVGFDDRLPSELSGGQQQRVAVARAIVLEPTVLLFDEPLSNLDAKLRRRVRDDIRALQRDLDLTVAYVTHDQDEALAVSDRIIVMDAGRIAQDGSPRDLYERPASRFVADFIGDANLLPARLRRLGDGSAEVTVGDLVLRLPDGAAAEGPVELAVRPHAIGLAPATPGAALIGTITKGAYLGDHLEYRVETALGELFVTSSAVDAPLAIGTKVAISIEASGAAVVPKDAAPAGRPL
jgi:iron(III) transport system ATP-binding protein